MLRVAFWASGIGLFAWAAYSARLRDEEGAFKDAFCLALSAAVALIVLGYACTKPFRESAFWFALALVGQAVALQMIDAGQDIRYQHYKPFGAILSGWNLLLLGYIVVQAALVTGTLALYIRRIHAWVRRHFKTWQLVGIAAVFLFSSAAVSRGVGFYSTELLFAALVQTISLANIILIGVTIPADSLARLRVGFDRLLRGAGAEERRRTSHFDFLALLMALWVVILAGVLSVFSYQRHPHVADEVAYLYQARFLASGALTMPAPPVQAGFDLYLMDVNGNRWFPSTPPGWPAALALGTILGIPWLINPLLAGINILLCYAFVSELYDRRTARTVSLLLCISPWYVFMAMNFMTHTFALTCSLVAAVGVLRARRSGKASWGWLVGFSVGIAFLVRPLDGLVLGLLIGVWVIGVGGQRLKASAITAFLMAGAISGGVTLGYNRVLTGHATVFPLNAYLDKEFGPGRNDFGFGANRGLGWALQPFPGHSPLGALVNADLNIFSLNTELFGWAAGSLILCAFLIFCATKHRADYVMLGVMLTVFLAYSCYWYSGGPDFGARYWYLMIVPLAVLTVRGFQFVRSKLESDPTLGADAGARMAVTLVLLCSLTLVNYFPWRATDKYHHYLHMRPDIREVAREHGFGRSLVLIRGESFPDYASAAIYNPLDLRDNAPVYAWDRGPDVRDRLLKAYRDRPVWIVNGTSITGRGFAVSAGPLRAADLMSTGSTNSLASQGRPAGAP